MATKIIMQIVDTDSGETLMKSETKIGFVGRNLISNNAEMDFYSLLSAFSKKYAKRGRQHDETAF